ncbi:hypothetical protein EDE05_12841 [Neorhizobium sp. R1-B]|uniref:hypothetical protein n=1 Tax=Neorhizobium sp. R1-B TaxID=2485162 RepID=UPI001066B70D|nr:hypothetical protein [Neorhizobium sp. R1-B]TDX72620.1 hypothetical protein EDE05_12841 [Neorhizobium sp. R1-B]
MQTQPYNPVSLRDVAFEMASIQRDRGYSLTREDFRKEGFTDEQITRYGQDAGVLFARMERGLAA